MEINWYPGHMAKTRRQLAEQIKRTDLVIELCDARLPFSSRNPDLDKMVGEKKRILLLNKSDLADPVVNARWIQYFRQQGIHTELIQAKKIKAKDAIQTIENEVKESVMRAAARGVRKTVRAMVVGVPNVGKSTYINQLRGANIAQTGDRPGITKNSQWIHVTPYLELMDTPGLLWPRLDNQIAAKRLSYLGTIRDEVLDIENLAISLLEDLVETIPEKTKERFHIKDLSLRGIELLDEVCRGRGFLMRGNEYDYERCCSVILDEFRGGKLGRLSLEAPEEEKKNGAN